MSKHHPQRNGRHPARRYSDLVQDTMRELEKRVLRGEAVDPTLVRQMRVLSAEAAEYGPAQERPEYDA